jgi:chemotaxis signal transduction protein
VRAEVWPEAMVSPLPLVGAGIIGLVARRGEVVGLFDIATWLGLPMSRGCKVVCLHMPHGAAALWTTHSPELVPLDERAVPAAFDMPLRLRPFMQGAVSSPSGPIWRLDLCAWFDAVASGASISEKTGDAHSVGPAI